MTNTQNLNYYSVAGQAGNAEGSVMLAVTAQISDTMDDAAFLAIVSALEAAFPTSWNITVASGNLQLTKSTDAITNWSVDTSANPPVFS